MRPSQLLSDTDADLDALTGVLWSALPAAADDPLSARLVAEALISLARSGADETVSEVFPGGAEYDVQTYGSGDIVGGVAVTGLAPADGVRCFANAVSADPDALIELVRRRGSGDERPMLIAAGGEAPRFVARDPATSTVEVSAPFDHVDLAGGAPVAPAGPVTRGVAPPSAPDDRDRPVPGRRDATRADVEPVAALAEVLAHLPTRGEIADAVRVALSESTVVVDLDDGAARPPAIDQEAWATAIADAVHARFVDDRRAPRAHDIADLIANLMPTADEVAEHVAHGDVGDQLAQLEGRLDQMMRAMGLLAAQVTSLEANLVGLRRSVGG